GGGGDEVGGGVGVGLGPGGGPRQGKAQPKPDSSRAGRHSRERARPKGSPDIGGHDMDQMALRRFLLDASRRGYAAGQSAVKTREEDHSTTIVLEQGEWRFPHKKFRGGAYGRGGGGFFPRPPGWGGASHPQNRQA